MFTGKFLKTFSCSDDQTIERLVGDWGMEEFVGASLLDAATPEQLDALAFQLRTAAPRQKDMDAWLAQAAAVEQEAASVRERTAAILSYADKPELFVRVPSEEADAQYLPRYVQFDLGRPLLALGFTSDYIWDGAHYRLSPLESGFTEITPMKEGASEFRVPTNRLIGLQSLGRLVPKTAKELPV